MEEREIGNWRVKYLNRAMELLAKDLTASEQEELLGLIKGLTPYGREHLQIWCEDQDLPNGALLG